MPSTDFDAPAEVAPSTFRLGSWESIPGLGWLPINAYLIKGKQPVLVDTGVASSRAQFLQHLANLVDPHDIRYIWITHMDADHIGNLPAVLQACPQAKVVTNSLGAAKMGLLGLPVERALLISTGQRLELGDRTLRCLPPPVFDAPETAGFLDSATRALFCCDCFGTPLPAPVETANQIPDADLVRGMLTWANIDAPWLAIVDKAAFGQRLRAYADLKPAITLGSHLQPAHAMLEQLVSCMSDAPDGPPA